MFIKLFSNVILMFIRVIEKIEYRNLELDENDVNKKVLTNNKLNIEVFSDGGFVNASNIIKTQPYTIYELQTNNGLKLQCADNHIIFDNYFNQIFIKNIKIGDKIQTKYGLDEVKSIIQTKHKISMFDLSITDTNHRYYTDDILSHNTTMVTMFLLWFALFHHTKNVFVLANKGETMIEIINKIKEIYRNLPFFLKCGLNRWGETYIKFENKSRIFGQATTKAPGVGLAINFLYIDEFAHIHPNIIEPFYENIYPVLTAPENINTSRFIITSSSNGENKFSELYLAAEAKKNIFTPLRVDWWEVEGRDEKWKEDMISQMGQDGFDRQFGNAFISNTSKLISDTTSKLWSRYNTTYINKDLSYSLEDLSILEQESFFWKPSYDVDELKNDYLLLSVDFAEGVGLDYSVIQIFKLSFLSDVKIRKSKNKYDLKEFIKLEQIGYFANNSIDPDRFAIVGSTFINNCLNYEKIKIIMEVNDNRYLSLYNTLVNKFDEDVFFKSKHSERAPIKKVGLKLKTNNRFQLLTTAKHKIEQSNLLIADEATQKQMVTFSRRKNGIYKSSSPNDDLAMAAFNAAVFFLEDDCQNLIEDFLDDNLDQFDIIDQINNKIAIQEKDDISELKENIDIYMDMVN